MILRQIIQYSNFRLKFGTWLRKPAENLQIEDTAKNIYTDKFIDSFVIDIAFSDEDAP